MNTDEVKKIVFREKPAFGAFYEKWKDKTWIEYLKAVKLPKKPQTKENLELLDVFEEQATEILGQEKAILGKKTLEENFFVSTCDHHGILNHPFFLNASLARSRKEKCVVVFAFGGISVSNSSYPRGVFFHDENLEENRIPFISLKHKSRPLYGIPAISKEKIEKKFDSAISKSEDLTSKKLEQIKEIIVSHERIFKLDTFSKQCSLGTNILWKETFGANRGELIYLEIEALVSALLLKIHLKTETEIYKIIFDRVWRESFLKNTNGITGSHDQAKKSGSHFFWYTDKEKRLQLFTNGNFLETLDKKISFEITPENISKLLAEQKILPTMALSFSVISFYHGLSCGGGFSQIDYLPQMEQAYKKTLEENGQKFKTENLVNNIFTGEFILAAFKEKNKNIPASLLDLFIYGDFELSTKIDALLEKTKIGDTLLLEMPEFYKIITGEKIIMENQKTISPVLSQKKSKKCIYCGNNPTNHWRAYFFQTITVPFIPLIRILSFTEKPFFQKIAKIVLTPYLKVAMYLGLVKMNKDKNKAFTKRSEVIWQEAEKRKIEMEQFVILGKPIEQYRAKINGSWRYFESLPLPDGGSSPSYAWMDDKAKLKKKFLEAKIPVAFGQSVTSLKKANQVFDRATKPVIVKPQLGSRGRHTTTYIYTKEELQNAYKIAKQLCHFVIVEEHLVGSVYRATYVGGEIVGILRGDPPRITGDGEKNIKELIEVKNANKKEQVKDVLITPLLIEFLKRQNLNLETILEKGKTIDLSEKIGISYGGFAAEEFPKTHPKLLNYLKNAGDILDAPVVGFDFIIKDATVDPDAQKWGIIEANSLPFINLHHFPLEGEPINVAAKVWDLWKK